MFVLRRRLTVTTWLVLSAQALVLALGTARVCADREHTHGGIAAPDCPMHHHAVPAATAEHAHHGHATHTTDDGGAQITCRCSEEGPSTYLGQVAVLELPVVASPSLLAEVLPRLPAVTALDHSFSPPSPPPRQSNLA